VHFVGLYSKIILQRAVQKIK